MSKTQIQLGSQVIVTVDRTPWRANNLLMVSVIWAKKAWTYWQFIPKIGTSNSFAQSDTMSSYMSTKQLSSRGSGRARIPQC